MCYRFSIFLYCLYHIRFMNVIAEFFQIFNNRADREIDTTKLQAGAHDHRWMAKLNFTMPTRFFLSILAHDSPPASISSSPTHESTSSRQSMLLPLVLATSSEIVFLVPFLFSGIFQWQGRKWCIDKIEHYTKNARYSSIRVQWKSRTGIPLQNYLMPSKIFAILQETNHRLVFDPPTRHFTRSQAIAIGNFYALHGSCTVEILHENFTKLQGNSRKDHIPLLSSLSCFCLFVNR